MDTDKIRNALYMDGYPHTPELEKTIIRLSLLEGEAKDMLLAWVNYGIEPKFENVEGINSNDLSQKVEMKSVAIILAFDMLVKYPEMSSFYKRLLTKRIQYQPHKL